MSDFASPIEHGYLLLADISGYTSFLAQTELDHAHQILAELLQTVLQRLGTLMTINKIEGDAIFACVPEAKIIRGETLLELVEAAYMEFREQQENMRRQTTCTCRACRSIPMLDLKFMAHHGDYAVQNIGGIRELAGSDVNLIHRLLKNHISETTGWRAYALFTQQSLEHLRLKPEGMVEAVEAYEHLGEVPVCVMDLHARYDELRQARRVVVEPEDALILLSEEIAAAPPVVWSWMNEPEKRALYSADGVAREFLPVRLPGGRTRPGAVTHCVHGRDIAMRERVLDWKPFEYFTVEQATQPLGVVKVTFRFEPLANGGTRLTGLLTGGLPPVPDFLGRPAIRFIYTRLFDYRSVLVMMKQVIEANTAIPE